MLVPWTPLSPSRRERSLRRLAQLLAFATGIAFLLAALRGDSGDPVLLLAGLLAIAAGLVAGRAAREWAHEVGIDDSGALSVRRLTENGKCLEQRLRCAFAAPWLITVGRGTMLVCVWPDSVPANVFRRLWAHIRWNPGRLPADFTSAKVPDREP